MELCTVLGRNHNTVRLLLSPAVHIKVLAYAKGLLYPETNASDQERRTSNGNGIAKRADNDIMPLDDEGAAAEAAVVPEAYSRDRCRRVAHRQWCVMLRIVGALVWGAPVIGRGVEFVRVETIHPFFAFCHRNLQSCDHGKETKAIGRGLNLPNPYMAISFYSISWI